MQDDAQTAEVLLHSCGEVCKCDSLQDHQGACVQGQACKVLS